MLLTNEKQSAIMKSVQNTTHKKKRGKKQNDYNFIKWLDFNNAYYNSINILHFRLEYGKYNDKHIPYNIYDFTYRNAYHYTINEKRRG